MPELKKQELVVVLVSKVMFNILIHCYIQGKYFSGLLKLDNNWICLSNLLIKLMLHHDASFIRGWRF